MTNKKLIQLLGRVNPAAYDALIPRYVNFFNEVVTQTSGVPLQNGHTTQTLSSNADGFSIAGSYEGSNSKATWRMLKAELMIQGTLTAILTRVQTVDYLPENQAKAEISAAQRHLADFVDDWCGTVPPKLKWPPKKHWWNDEMLSPEVLVRGAVLFQDAADAFADTEIGDMLSKGAEQFLNTAIKLNEKSLKAVKSNVATAPAN